MMPDQKTIDRVAVGLAELAIRHRDCDRRIHRDVGIKTPPPGSSHFGFLCPLIGLPEPIPDWAKRALEEHQGTPEELVATLRELAGKEAAKPLEPVQQGTCVRCGGEIRRARLGWGPWGNWAHVGKTKDHPATFKGEPK